MPHNLSWGLASARRRWPVCIRARHISSFWEDFARLCCGAARLSESPRMSPSGRYENSGPAELGKICCRQWLAKCCALNVRIQPTTSQVSHTVFFAWLSYPGTGSASALGTSGLCGCELVPSPFQARAQAVHPPLSTVLATTTLNERKKLEKGVPEGTSMESSEAAPRGARSK